MQLFPLLLLAAGGAAFNVARSTLSDCLTTANVPVVLTTSSSWSSETVAFNLRFSWTPAVVAMPTTVTHVSAAVSCAAKTNTKVTARSGGHSYAAYGLGGENGHLMIDLQNFSNVTLDSSTKIATVGAGVRLGNMATQLYSLGKRGLPHGTCSGVGIGGHATFGGFGLDSRLWGLTVDMIQQMTAVLANGTIITTTPTKNPDLFWALAGAAPSFAIVTEFKLTTFAAIETNINWAYAYTFSDAATAAKAFIAAQKWGLESAPKELGYGILLFPGGGFTVRGVYYGQKSTFTTLIAPLLAQLKKINGNQNPTATINTYGWLDSLTDLSGGSLSVVQHGYSEHDTFYAKSIVTKNATPLTLTAVTNMFTYLISTPTSASWIAIINLYGGPNSTINSLPASTSPSSHSSYGHRDAGYVFQLYANTPNNQLPWDPSYISFVEGIVGSLGDEATDLQAYAPYVDSELTRAVAQVKYWGDGVTRLKQVKTVWDPAGVFEWPQGF